MTAFMRLGFGEFLLFASPPSPVDSLPSFAFGSFRCFSSPPGRFRIFVRVVLEVVSFMRSDANPLRSAFRSLHLVPPEFDIIGPNSMELHASLRQFVSQLLAKQVPSGH